MQKTTIILPAINLIGITARTSNKNELDWGNGKILPCIQKYFGESISEKIPNRKHKGTTYCVYTDYESDFNGEYTYFIGEEVDSIDSIPSDLKTVIIPSQTYIKFTNGPGPMPNVVKEPWQKIWQMTPEDLGGERNYIADFEIYDERASDHQNVVLDIYIGIKI